MKNKKKLYILSGLGVAAGAAVAAWFMKKDRKKTDDYLLAGESEDEIFLDYVENTEVSYEDAEEKALSAAKAKLGQSAVVVSASDNKALTVNIGGESRHCYMFGASCDSLSPIAETLIFYVDSASGEVFGNGAAE
ncbi:MAG: hypothetical protein IKW02_01635 [Clostridia bacterium]|nr:hypothetical protein [Clostridia bacterium]